MNAYMKIVFLFIIGLLAAASPAWAAATITPDSGPIGITVTITGEGFGKFVSPKANRVLFENAAGLVEQWEDTRIVVRVPRKAATGTVALRSGKKTHAKSDTHLRFVEHFSSGGEAVLQSACRMNLEGIVSKKQTAPYVSGRGDSWTKSKCRAGHEVVIGGWSTTAGKFRSLLVGVHRGDHLIYVGRVGTGYSAEKVRRLMPRLMENDPTPEDLNWHRALVATLIADGERLLLDWPANGPATADRISRADLEAAVRGLYSTQSMWHGELSADQRKAIIRQVFGVDADKLQFGSAAAA